MPWRELSVIDQREEFVRLAAAGGLPVSELCRRFGISRSNGYKWLARYRAGGREGLADLSRRPHHSPARSDATLEATVVAVRGRHPAWGGRKIQAVLCREGVEDVPAASTITEILRRHGCLADRDAAHPGRYQRFERAAPNELWQMDFKGHFAIGSGRCHALGVLDDHSRYALGLEACGDELETTVRSRLQAIFQRYGLPLCILADNGAPWGDCGQESFTALGVWLLRLGIGLTHGRPRHPQTQGKEERFHRTLKLELLDGRSFADLADCQRRFDAWRRIYNHERPHQALDYETPGKRYKPSPRPFPETLPPIEYGQADLVRKVNDKGCISFKGRPWRVGKAFHRLPIALRHTSEDGVFSLHFCSHRIGTIDLRRPPAEAGGFVDNAAALPTTPPSQLQQPDSHNA